MKTILAVSLVTTLAAAAAAQPTSPADAMRQAEQYQKTYGGGKVQPAPPAVPPHVPGMPPAVAPSVPGLPVGVPANPAVAPHYGKPEVPSVITGQPQKLPDPVELTSNELTSFISAVKGLNALGIETGKRAVGSQAKQMAQAYASNAQAMSVLTSNGFSAQRFQQVAYTVGMAMAGLDMQGQADDLAAARAQQEEAMATLKDRMTPEQYELMRQQLGAANHTLDQVKNQPAKNLELVGAHRAELEAVLDDGR